MLKTVLAVHIAGGTAALLSMFVPLITRKGGTTHRKGGWVFVGGMTIVSITAFILATARVLTDPTPRGQSAGIFLFFVSILTAAGVSAGIRVLRARKRTAPHRSWWDLGMSVVLTIASTLMAAYGLATGQVLFSAFSVIGLASGAGQLVYWLRVPTHPMHWWFQHMTLMLGSCIAAVTAFLVVNAGRLGAETFSLVVWLSPAVVGGLTIALWTAYYRRRFAGAARVRPDAAGPQRAPA